MGRHRQYGDIAVVEGCPLTTARGMMQLSRTDASIQTVRLPRCLSP